MTTMNQAKVLFWSAAEVDAGDVPSEHLGPVQEILAWARQYLDTPHPELGRNGPVCPYTQPSLHKGLFHLAALAGDGDVNEAIEGMRGWYERIGSTLSAGDRDLLTVLLALPQLDYDDASGLDKLQGAAKAGT